MTTTRNRRVDPRGGRFNVTKVGPILEELHERLAGVVIVTGRRIA
jgi:hypothetical protein